MNISIKSMALAGLLSLASLQVVSADHHGGHSLKAKIQSFYMNLSQGQIAEALAFVKSGAKGFMPFGVVRTFPQEEARQMAVAEMQRDREAGYEFKGRPAQIGITELSEKHALATFYVDGFEKEPGGKREHVLNRVSLVLEKGEEDWQICHWHISRLERDDD